MDTKNLQIPVPDAGDHSHDLSGSAGGGDAC